MYIILAKFVHFCLINFWIYYMELVVNPFRYYGTCYDFASFVNNIVYAKTFKNSKIHSWSLKLYIFDMSWIWACIEDVFPKIEKVLQWMDVHLVMSVDIWNVGLWVCGSSVVGAHVEFFNTFWHTFLAKSRWILIYDHLSHRHHHGGWHVIDVAGH